VTCCRQRVREQIEKDKKDRAVKVQVQFCFIGMIPVKVRQMLSRKSIRVESSEVRIIQDHAASCIKYDNRKSSSQCCHKYSTKVLKYKYSGFKSTLSTST